MTYVMLVVATTPTEKQGASFYTKFGRSDKLTSEMLQFLNEIKHHEFWDMSDAARGFLAGKYAEDGNPDSDEYKRGLALGREFWTEEVDDIPRFPPMPVIETWGLIINVCVAKLLVEPRTLDPAMQFVGWDTSPTSG